PEPPPILFGRRTAANSGKPTQHNTGPNRHLPRLELLLLHDMQEIVPSFEEQTRKIPQLAPTT
ncbi:MAG: hypothetical protein QGH25_11390, partial [Candidatus Latescibacteria bacterium]|nr:hypothetical protein [Candidatus Latescibacterota bacterium]